MARQLAPTADSSKTPDSVTHTPQNRGATSAVLQRLEQAPQTLRPADVLQLQRSIGNRATGLLLQTKLKLGPAGDRYEQEADRVAKQVVSASRQPAVQREEGQEGGDEGIVQTSRYADSISTLQRNSVPAPSGFFVARPQMPKVQREEVDDEMMQAKPLAGSVSLAQRVFAARPQMPKVQRDEMEDELQASRYADSISTLQRDAVPSPLRGFVARPLPPKVQRDEMDDELMQAKPITGSVSLARRVFAARPQISQVQRDEMDDEMMQAKPLAASISSVQREEMDDELQASPNHGLEGGDVDAGVARSIQSAKGGGQPLHDGVRSSMERGFGADFSGVNVHAGPKADALNRSLNARAFTTGKDIFFGKGQYSPGSTGGQELIAHELTHTVQQGAAGVQRQPRNGQLLQRTLNPSQLNRLKRGLGQGKFGKVVAAKQDEFFHKLADDKLLRFKTMRNTHFDELIKGLSGGMISKLLASPSEIGQVADLLGAAVETGEDAAQVAAMLPSLLSGMGSVLSASSDVAMEGLGGGIGGIKDTYEGGSAIVKQQKYVEGGLTTLAGLSGLVSLIPGVPDVVGVAGAGAKSVAGMAKMANTKISRNAIARLRVDAAANPAVLAALDILDGKLGYTDGMMQTGLGAFEGAGALAGGVGKYATSAFSKGIETLPGWLGWAGRGIASTVTSRVDSNETVRQNEELEKSEMKVAMREAVETVKNAGLPEHIGRLHRLATLIDPDLAEAMDDAVASLHSVQRDPVIAAIKLKATWNPS